MRRIAGVAFMALIGLVIAGCASTMTVSSHIWRGLDIAQYRTYDWGPADALPTGDPRLDDSPLFQDHMQGAVEKELAVKGFERGIAGTADLLVHYHANISRRFDVDRLDRAYGYCASGNCPPGLMEYEAGTLVLDIIDARTNRMIWRGWAQNSLDGVLDNPDRLEKTIKEAVTRMLSQFPATAITGPLIGQRGGE